MAWKRGSRENPIGQHQTAPTEMRLLLLLLLLPGTDPTLTPLTRGLPGALGLYSSPQKADFTCLDLDCLVLVHLIGKTMPLLIAG